MEQGARAGDKFTTSQGQLKRNDNVEATIQKMIIEWFDKDEFAQLAFEMAIDYDRLPGDTLDGKVRAFVGRVGNKGKIGELILRLQDERPHVTWPILPEAHKREQKL